MNKYDVIIADPPWHYGASVNTSCGQANVCRLSLFYDYAFRSELADCDGRTKLYT